jgi:hypothetical protein
MNPTHRPDTPADDTGWLTTGELLNAAAAYLDRHGWHQGAFYPERYTVPFPPACTVGAIRVAVCGRPMRFLENLTAEQVRLIRAAERFLAGYLNDEFDSDRHIPTEEIGDWNDHDGRTADEVIAVLTDAAHEWHWRHRTGGAR